MTYPIAAIGTDADEARKLRSRRIRTAEGLLEAAKNPKGRKVLASKTGYDEAQILRWANLADRMRIRGVREPYAELLRAAGVETIRDLKYRNPCNLAKSMAEVNSRRKLVRFLPSEKLIEQWIEDAKKLQPKITYR